MNENMDIQTIINGHDYFYCERTKCRLRLSVCIKRQESNKDNYADKSLYLCEGCSRVRSKCRLSLPVCLKSPNVNKKSRQSFPICKNCSQGNENIISDNNLNEKQKINLSILACSTAENHDEGKDKGIDGKAVLRQAKERKNHFIDKNSIQI